MQPFLNLLIFLTNYTTEYSLSMKLFIICNNSVLNAINKKKKKPKNIYDI